MPRRPRLPALALALLLVAPLAASCSARRPSLSNTRSSELGGNAGTPTGDAGVDAVLAALETPLATSFTLTYAVTRKLGVTRATAVVSRSPLASSVTIGDIRFLRADSDHTCVLSTKVCEDKINDARISDLGLSSLFWRDAPARALRVTYGRRSAPATASQTTIAGQAATCVDVPVGTGTEHYCALAGGAIARWDTAYLTVELTAFEPTTTQEAFTIPTVPGANTGG